MTINKLHIKYAKRHPNAVIPSHAKPGDAGVDLTATEISWDNETQTYVVSFGLSIELPEGTYAEIVPRSSIYKYNHLLTNSVGIIDSGYRGVIGARFTKRVASGLPEFKVGERVAQLIVKPYYEQFTVEVPYESMSTTERNQGGFGSSGS